jgi:hypothetical protein
MKTYILILLLNFYFVLNKTYKYLSYDEIFQIFKDLSETCSHYIRIDTSQRRYNLPHAGDCGSRPCSNLIVFMTDFATLEVNRPQIYLSGLVHGDEVIGATVLTELALYLCKSPTVKWVENLLKNRYIVMTPITNAYGYYHNQRTDFVITNGGENQYLDPNRDFSYFNNNGNSEKECMQTVTARTVNELAIEHLFISTLTFHGGLNAIGYPWGNYIHLKNNMSSESPDFIASKKVGNIMKDYSSSRTNHKIKDYDLDDAVAMVLIIFIL